MNLCTSFQDFGPSMMIVCNSCYEFKAASKPLDMFCFMYPSHAFLQSHDQPSLTEGSLLGNLQHDHKHQGHIVVTNSHIMDQKQQVIVKLIKYQITKSMLFQSQDNPFSKLLCPPELDKKESVPSSHSLTRQADNTKM